MGQPVLIVINKKTFSSFSSVYFPTCSSNYLRFSKFQACPGLLLTWKLILHDTVWWGHFPLIFWKHFWPPLHISQSPLNKAFPSFCGLPQYLRYAVLLFLLNCNKTTWSLKARSSHSPKSACKELVFRIYLRNIWIKEGLGKTREQGRKQEGMLITTNTPLSMPILSVAPSIALYH